MATSGGGGSGGGGTPKAVTIAEPESISPMLEPIGEEVVNAAPPHSPKLRRASMAKRLSGRASITPSSSFYSLSGSPFWNPPDCASSNELQNDPHTRLVAQLVAWISDEKARRARSGAKASRDSEASSNDHPAANRELEQPPTDVAGAEGYDSSMQKLEQIISDSIEYAQKMGPTTPAGTQTQTSYFPRRKSSTRKLRKASAVAASSDTEYQDGDAIVPSADVVLDNSKTLGYSGGEAGKDAGGELDSISSKRAAREKEGWKTFKFEIVRLAHTLRLKGWRRVPLEQASEIEVKRLSGALTNAVYVVFPPAHLSGAQGDEPNASAAPKRSPTKLLLRIYGPQVEHLIDRDTELQILRRLARKNIGPRLLGTFQNGRFEQFFNATTLTPEDLRNSATSQQIAKRMRELHDGIELLPSEREAGPFVWQNWDKWVARCEEVITWLDAQIVAQKGPVTSRSEAWKTRGFVCGVEWAKFRKAVDNYRKWLDEQYGGKAGTRSKLVFAHNDAQYGNLLRLEPSGTSPLLLPANEHKQLVVIDFEYANANAPGLEFANHFTEWCYNYHSPTNSHVCNTSTYPTPSEQTRFLKSYVQHVPGYNIRSPPATPQSQAGGSSSISSFMLDSRGPPSSYDAEEKIREDRMQREVERLMKETRLWRIANSAQWVAWGIVQAKVPGMDEALEAAKKRKRHMASRLVAKLTHHRGKSHDRANGAPAEAKHADKTEESNADGELALEALKEEESAEAVDDIHVPHEHEMDDEPDFDYLAYAQERALFFWGDLLEFGLVKEEELPEYARKHAKRINY